MPISERSLAPPVRLFRAAALAAICLATPLLGVGDARAQFAAEFYPVGQTRETIPVYDPYALPFGGSIGSKAFAWSTPLVVSTHIINNPVTGTQLNFFGDTNTPNTTDGGQWAYQDYTDFNDPGAIRPSTNHLFLYSGGSVIIHVLYYLAPGQTVVPDQGGLPTISVINSCGITAAGYASYGYTDDGTGKQVFGTLLNNGDGTATAGDLTASYTGSAVALSNQTQRLTVPTKGVQTDPSGRRYVDCGVYTVKGSLLLHAHQSYPLGIYVAGAPYSTQTFPWANTFLQFSPSAVGNKASDTGAIRGGPGQAVIPFGTLPRGRNEWYDAQTRRWCFSPAARKMLAGMGIDPDTSPIYKPVYGGTITHKNGLSYSHSLADNRLIDQATGGGMVAVQKAIQQAEFDQIIDAIENPLPDDVASLPVTWGTDTGTYSGSGSGG